MMPEWIRLMTSLLVIAATFTFPNLTQADEELTDKTQMRRWAHHIQQRSINITSPIQNRELEVVTIKSSPYVMETTGPEGETQYIGFIVDLMDGLSRKLGFTYKFHFSHQYGYYDNNTGEWTGMIGEVIKRSTSDIEGADVAAAAITITAAREKVVDFLKPFQHLGLSVIIKKPTTAEDITQYSFSIFQPFSPSVWALIFLAVIVVGLYLWLMNRYNPYEWGERYGLGQASIHHAELFNLAGSIWFAFTTLQRQGFQRSPRSIASKFLGCVWFAFVTVVLVTYTAGMVNQLFWASTVHGSIPIQAPFVDLAHLITSKEYKYGVIANGQSFKYLSEVAVGEEFEVLRQYWKTPDGQAQLVASGSDGLEKVRAEKYALITESTLAKYVINQRPCDLMTVGDTFGMRSYGLALPLNSPIRKEMHLGILEMIEEGDIDEIERRWFSDRSQCWNETVRERSLAVAAATSAWSNSPKSVDLSMFWGPIVLVTAGIIIGLVIAVAEIIYYRIRGKYQSSNQQLPGHLQMDRDGGTN